VGFAHRAVRVEREALVLDDEALGDPVAVAIFGHPNQTHILLIARDPQIPLRNQIDLGDAIADALDEFPATAPRPVEQVGLRRTTGKPHACENGIENASRGLAGRHRTVETKHQMAIRRQGRRRDVLHPVFTRDRHT
jgi:hypothetical protein